LAAHQPERADALAGAEQRKQREQHCEHGEDDGRLPRGDGDLALLVADDGLCHGAHTATPFFWGFGVRLRPPGCGRRKIARTSGGAAMNSTISDCTTSTTSFGTCSAACIVKPPALNMPKRMPAK